MKTREEVNKLKHDWASDPIYELTEVIGFEEYQEELIAFKDKKETQWKLEATERERRSSEFNIDKAIDLMDYAQTEPVLRLATVHALVAIATELREIRVNGLSIEDIHRPF